MNAPSPTIPNFARGLMDTLHRFVRRLPELSVDEALDRLSELQQSARKLESFCKVYAGQAAAREDAACNMLLDLNDELHQSAVELELLEQQLQELAVQFEEPHPEHPPQADLERFLIEIQRQMQVHLHGLSGRLQELKKWFWMPVYRQYLSVRAYWDQDIARYRAAVTELDAYFLEAQPSGAQIQVFSRSIESLTAADGGCRQRIEQLECLQRELLSERFQLKQGLLLASEAQMALQELAAQLDCLKSDLRDGVPVKTVTAASLLPLLYGKGQKELPALYETLLLFAAHAGQHPLNSEAPLLPTDHVQAAFTPNTAASRG